jgi:hypothetical protein
LLGFGSRIDPLQAKSIDNLLLFGDLYVFKKDDGIPNSDISRVKEMVRIRRFFLETEIKYIIV